MSNTNGRAAKPSRGFFHKDREPELLAQAVGEPTGILAEVGGVTFDLVPLDTFTGVRLFNTVARIGIVWGKMQNGSIKNDAEIESVLADDLPWILGIIKSTLLDSARCEDEDFDEAVFDAWFDKTRFIPTLEAIAPKILRANGMDMLADQAENAIARFKNKPDPSQPANKPVGLKKAKAPTPSP